MIAASIGIILMGLLRTRLRWSGALVLAASIAWTLMVPQADILISADGHNVAVRGRDGRLRLMRTGKDAFLIREWLAADADARIAGDVSLADGVSCDDAGCVAALADGGLVAQSLRADTLADDCVRAVLVVTARQPPKDCSASVIDQDRLRRQGALAIRRTAKGFAVDAVKPRGFDRPWSPAVAGEGDLDAPLLARPAAPRGRDATPSETDLQAED
jgi:competence protein ComEC